MARRTALRWRSVLAAENSSASVRFSRSSSRKRLAALKGIGSVSSNCRLMVFGVLVSLFLRFLAVFAIHSPFELASMKVKTREKPQRRQGNLESWKKS